MDTEYAIVGGGVVGLSVAYGLLKLGKRVVVFDEGDGAFRASRGNFGLVWVQGKGASEPGYARWTMHSARLWNTFARDLETTTGNVLNLRQEGGFSYFFDDESLEATVEKYNALKAQLDGDYSFEVLGSNALRSEEPNIGPTVTGAILHYDDGHVNPLVLLRSLALAVRQLDGDVKVNSPVLSVQPGADGFSLTTNFKGQAQQCQAQKVVLCAGLGSAELGPSLGFKAPIRAQRGQVLITEKLPPIMHRPSGVIRQVDEGGVQIGASEEEVGVDDSETIAVTAELARQATLLFPKLEKVNLVRTWAALRIMSPDGLPIYQQSSTYPGAFYVTCHSGITLAAAHAVSLPPWLTEAADLPDLSVFSEGRFDV